MSYIENYLIVLFKNKTKKKIIKKFKTHKKAKEFFDAMVKDFDEVLFEKQYENGVKSKYEIALLEKTSGTLLPIFLKDELGRQVKINLDDSDYTISKIVNYKEDELILDYSTSSKITVKELIESYLNVGGIKLVFKLNNKIVIQNDDKFNLFTLKNEHDSSRLIECLIDEFIVKGKYDCIFVGDYSRQQRKYLYDLLVKNGFPKNYLVRHSTTHPTKT